MPSWSYFPSFVHTVASLKCYFQWEVIRTKSESPGNAPSLWLIWFYILAVWTQWIECFLRRDCSGLLMLMLKVDATCHKKRQPKRHLWYVFVQDFACLCMYSFYSLKPKDSYSRIVITKSVVSMVPSGTSLKNDVLAKICLVCCCLLQKLNFQVL